MTKISAKLLGKSLPELTNWVEAQGQPKYRGKQLYEWLYQKGARSLSEISVFPKQWREDMGDIPIGRSTIHHSSTAPDQTRKYLLRLEDGLIVETVGIPTSKRLTVCVSTQVGCAMACDFCATGKGGFKRNLKAYEIIDQVLTVQSHFNRRVSHVVFMGMGEPLLNLKQVLLALRSINQDIGIGGRSLTVSSVGIVGKIRELAEHRLQMTFALSLHAPNQSLRESLIPTAVHNPIDKLLEESKEYVRITGRRVSFEYILLAGVNDLPEYAQQLAGLLRGFQSHVNLIPYNPISEADYQRPDQQSVQEFADILNEKQIACSIRQSRGLATNAACGQLRAGLTT